MVFWSPMKKLIFALFMGLGLGFTSLAFAFNYTGDIDLSELGEGYYGQIVSLNSAGIGYFSANDTQYKVIATNDTGINVYLLSDTNNENALASTGFSITYMQDGTYNKMQVLEIQELIGYIVVSMGSFFLFIGLVLATVAGSDYLFSKFKKIFPNASR